LEFNFTKKSTARALGNYGLASAVFVAAVPAQAALVYSGRIDDPVADNTSVFVDLDGDGTDDFDVSAQSFFAGPFSVGQVLINAFGTNGVTGVSEGTAIDGSLAYSTPYTVVSSAFKVGFPPDGPKTASVVAGLKFDIDGATHYGWMRVSGYANGDIPEARAILHDFAYEDIADAAVIAPAAVPEPSSLALFALGAAGVAALKRRRAA
jgi:hypothetical protein